ncbi:unnamed protein product [Cyprideis torosa]|uniref:Uncharacterized protein n=1 Tax=Cyprideis torosa TaxID=163714 RepID=A0A7R8WD78_9CRUS|nr:unnamed protein product [Cyprideis torosa]CAG0894364.1 unnamed protein product [Cyprideis torosa]
MEVPPNVLTAAVTVLVSVLTGVNANEDQVLQKSCESNTDCDLGQHCNLELRRPTCQCLMSPSPLADGTCPQIVMNISDQKTLRLQHIERKIEIREWQMDDKTTTILSLIFGSFTLALLLYSAVKCRALNLQMQRENRNRLYEDLEHHASAPEPPSLIMCDQPIQSLSALMQETKPPTYESLDQCHHKPETDLTGFPRTTTA